MTANKHSAFRTPHSAIAKVGGEPVSEFLLIPFGAVGVDRAVAGGDFTFTRAQAQATVEWFKTSGRKLAIDYEHQTFDDLNTREDGLKPAAGWIGGLEVRADGLWAAGVEWTEKARSLLASGEYRYFSPVIYWTDKEYSDVQSLGPVALTNDPAMHAVPALAAGRGTGGPATSGTRHVSLLPGREIRVKATERRSDGATKGKGPRRQSSIGNRQSPTTRRREATRGRSAHLLAALEKGEMVMEQLLQILGLSAEASLEDVLAAVTEENHTSVAEALGLPAEATLEEVRAAIEELFAQAGDGGGGSDEGGGGGAPAGATAAKRDMIRSIAKQLQLGDGIDDAAILVANVKSRLAGTASNGAQLQTLLKRVGELETENAEHAWEKFLAGKAAGKVTPAMTETVKGIFMRDRAEAEQLVAELPVIASTRSRFAGDKATGGPVGGADNEAGWKKEYEANRANPEGVPLQDEFDSVENYVAFRKHQKAGHVQILGSKRQ